MVTWDPLWADRHTQVKTIPSITSLVGVNKTIVQICLVNCYSKRQKVIGLVYLIVVFRKWSRAFVEFSDFNKFKESDESQQPGLLHKRWQIPALFNDKYFYRLQQKLQKSNVFTPVYHSVHRGGGLPTLLITYRNKDRMTFYGTDKNWSTVSPFLHSALLECKATLCASIRVMVTSCSNLKSLSLKL